MQDPVTFVTDVIPSLACAVDPRQPAKLDAQHCVQINDETFFVAASVAKTRLLSAPLAYCGRLTDPVTQLRFTPTKRSPRLEWKGKPYYFSSDSTRALFASTPDSFAAPRVKMVTM